MRQIIIRGSYFAKLASSENGEMLADAIDIRVIRWASRVIFQH
jgi:hypothetical protein